jgi:hypothetical protein
MKRSITFVGLWLCVSACSPEVQVADGSGGSSAVEASASTGDYSDEFLSTCEGYCGAWDEHLAGGCDEETCLKNCEDLTQDDPCLPEDLAIRRCSLAGAECTTDCTEEIQALEQCERDHGIHP